MKKIVWTVAILLSFYPQFPRAEESAPHLWRAQEALTSPESSVVVEALEELSRLCDERCVPSVLDMLHHDNADVVRAACQTAQVFANPMFAPALFDLVRNHPNEGIRFEAIHALTSLEHGYEALVYHIQSDQVDGVTRQIIRHLPARLRAQYAEEFAGYATRHDLSSSVAHAYRGEGARLLMPHLVARYYASDAAGQANLLRTMAFVCATNRACMTPEEASLFDGTERLHLDAFARIQAHRSAPDGVIWLASRSGALSDALLIEVLSLLLPQDAARLSAFLAQSDSERCARGSRTTAP